MNENTYKKKYLKYKLKYLKLKRIKSKQEGGLENNKIYPSVLSLTPNPIVSNGSEKSFNDIKLDFEIDKKQQSPRTPYLTQKSISESDLLINSKFDNKDKKMNSLPNLTIKQKRCFYTTDINQVSKSNKNVLCIINDLLTLLSGKFKKKHFLNKAKSYVLKKDTFFSIEEQNRFINSLKTLNNFKEIKQYDVKYRLLESFNVLINNYEPSDNLFFSKDYGIVNVPENILLKFIYSYYEKLVYLLNKIKGKLIDKSNDQSINIRRNSESFNISEKSNESIFSRIFHKDAVIQPIINTNTSTTLSEDFKCNLLKKELNKHNTSAILLKELECNIEFIKNILIKYSNNNNITTSNKDVEHFFDGINNLHNIYSNVVKGKYSILLNTLNILSTDPYDEKNKSFNYYAKQRNDKIEKMLLEIEKNVKDALIE